MARKSKATSNAGQAPPPETVRKTFLLSGDLDRRMRIYAITHRIAIKDLVADAIERRIKA